MWLVKGADGRHDEYVCASAEGGAFTWELVGGLTSLELNEAFYTRQQADARFAGLVNGVQVAQGEVTIGMQDIPGHGDYALSADVTALVSSRLAEAKRYADVQDEFVSGRLRQDLAGAGERLQAQIDMIRGELELELTYKGYIDGLDNLESIPDAEKLIGDVKVVRSLAEEVPGDASSALASLDCYMWTGAPDGSDPSRRGWLLIGPISGNRLSAQFASKEYLKVKASETLEAARQSDASLRASLEAAIGESARALSAGFSGGLSSLSGAADGRVSELSSAANAKFATNAYLTGTFSENIRDWVSLQIGQSVTSLLKFREVFDGTFAELAEHVTLDERRIGDVYLVPGTVNGAQVYEEYVVKGTWSEADGAFRPTGQNSDFELLGTVDVAQMENYYTKREADMMFAPLSYVDGEFLKSADAAAAYAGLGDFRAVSSSLGEARSGLGALSAEWEAEKAILCGRLSEVQQNLAEVMESYCLLSSCIGRRTVYHAGLSAIMPEHLIPEVTPESFSQPLNLIRHDQFFTVSTLSDFGSLSYDVTFRLPNPNSAAKPIPAGASVSYAITNPTDEARSLTVYSETDDPLTPDSVELLIPASSEQHTILATFTVLYTGGGKKGWVMLKDKTN